MHPSVNIAFSNSSRTKIPGIDMFNSMYQYTTFLSVVTFADAMTTYSDNPTIFVLRDGSSPILMIEDTACHQHCALLHC